MCVYLYVIIYSYVQKKTFNWFLTYKKKEVYHKSHTAANLQAEKHTDRDRNLLLQLETKEKTSV